MKIVISANSCWRSTSGMWCDATHRLSTIKQLLDQALSLKVVHVHVGTRANEHDGSSWMKMNSLYRDSTMGESSIRKESSQSSKLAGYIFWMNHAHVEHTFADERCSAKFACGEEGTSWVYRTKAHLWRVTPFHLTLRRDESWRSTRPIPMWRSNPCRCEMANKRKTNVYLPLTVSSYPFWCQTTCKDFRTEVLAACHSQHKTITFIDEKVRSDDLPR